MGHIGIHLQSVFLVGVELVGGRRSRKDVTLGVFFYFGKTFQSMDFFLGKEFWGKLFILM